MEQTKKLARISLIEQYKGPYGLFYLFYFKTQEDNPTTYCKVITPDFPYWKKMYVSMGCPDLDPPYDAAPSLLNNIVELVFEENEFKFINRLTDKELLKRSQLVSNQEELGHPFPEYKPTWWERIKSWF